MINRKAMIDSRSGDSSSGSGAKEQDLLVSGITRNPGSGSAVQVSLLRYDRDSRLQHFLLLAVHNTQEAYRLFRRLGLPENSVGSKLPYTKSVQAEGGHRRVWLQPHMMAALQARSAGPMKESDKDRAPRPKPRFRTHAPGFIEVVGANILLMWACATIKV